MGFIYLKKQKLVYTHKYLSTGKSLERDQSTKRIMLNNHMKYKSYNKPRRNHLKFLKNNNNNCKRYGIVLYYITGLYHEF